MISAYRAVTEQLLLKLSPIIGEIEKLKEKLGGNMVAPYEDFQL